MLRLLVVNESPTPDPEVLQALHLERGPARWPWYVALVAAVVLAGAAVVGARRPAESGRWSYETAEAIRGDLTVRVTAVGQLRPVNAVQISSELSGIVQAVHADLDQRVQAGEALARLDASLLRSQDRQTTAAIAAAEAALDQARIQQSAAQRELARNRTVARDGGLAAAALEQSETGVQAATAAVALARAQVAQAEAAAGASRTQLRKTTIRSPIDGVVLERNVEPGQAVVSALQAQTLFVVAETLETMEVACDIDEADIGRLEAGQQAEFTVAAHPDRVFPATVRQVHLAPKPGLGVVTYRAILDAPNADRALLPGMTATAHIDTATLIDVLLVPNAALRWAPQEGDPPPPPLARGGRRVARAWVLDDGEPTPIEVLPGVSDGRHTVVESGDLRPGRDVIVAAVDRRERGP